MNLQQKLIPAVVALVMLSPGQVLAQAAESPQPEPPPQELPTISAANWMYNLEVRRSQRLTSFGSNLFVLMMSGQGVGQLFGNIPGMAGGECTTRCGFLRYRESPAFHSFNVNASASLLSLLEVMARYGIADANMADAMGTGYGINSRDEDRRMRSRHWVDGRSGRSRIWRYECEHLAGLEGRHRQELGGQGHDRPGLGGGARGTLAQSLWLFGAGSGMMLATADAMDAADATQEAKRCAGAGGSQPEAGSGGENAHRRHD